MAKTIDPALADQLRRESERTKDDAYPPSTAGRRPNRQKVYSVRLRSWILEQLDRERSA